MIKCLATYDLKDTSPDPHKRFLELAEGRNWFCWRLIDDEFYRLPNTTLFGKFKTISDAIRAFKGIVADLRSEEYTVVLEKWVVVEYDEATFASNKKIEQSR